MTLEDRVHRLESDAKTWRIVAGVLAGLLLASVACNEGNQVRHGPVANAAAQPERPSANTARPPDVPAADTVTNEIRTRALVLVNENGKRVASFEAESVGATLVIGAPDDTAQIQLKTGAEPSLMLTDISSGILLLTPTLLQMADTTAEFRLAWKSLLDAGQAHKDAVHRGNATPSELKGLVERGGKLQAEIVERSKRLKSIVTLGKAEHGGGIIDVFNTLGNRVVSVQAAKDNSGMVMLNKLSGEFSKGLKAE